MKCRCVQVQAQDTTQVVRMEVKEVETDMECRSARRGGAVHEWADAAAAAPAEAQSAAPKVSAPHP